MKLRIANIGWCCVGLHVGRQFFMSDFMTVTHPYLGSYQTVYTFNATTPSHGPAVVPDVMIMTMFLSSDVDDYETYPCIRIPIIRIEPLRIRAMQRDTNAFAYYNPLYLTLGKGRRKQHCTHTVRNKPRSSDPEPCYLHQE